MKRVLLSAFLVVAIATATASLADVQPDIRATGVSLALATSNAAITVPLNFGITMMHWQIVTGGTVNAADRLIFENSPDGGTTWDGAPVVQYSTGTGTSTAFQGSIAVGGTLTPVASTTYDVFVPTGNETQTRVRVSTNHAGDSAATVAYSASAVGFVPSQRFDANGNPYVNCAVNCGTPNPQPTFPYSVTTAPPYVAPTCGASSAPCASITGPVTVVPSPGSTWQAQIVGPPPAGWTAAPLVSPAPDTAITPAAVATASASVQFYSGAVSLTTFYAEILGGTISTATQCVFALYDSSGAPTLSTVPKIEITWSTASTTTVAFPISPTSGLSFANGIWFADVTVAGGSTACNTAAGGLRAGGAHR